MTERPRGRLFLSCGHEALDDDEGTMVIYKEEVCDMETGFAPALAYATWCRDCVATRVPDPKWEVFATEAEANAWLDSHE